MKVHLWLQRKLLVDSPVLQAHILVEIVEVNPIVLTTFKALLNQIFLDIY